MVEKVPYDVIERPKMPRATWDALRAHIVRERQKKKEENREFERQKLAREHKKKQDASTLEDIKEQIQQLESKLDELKREKHELFSTLKRVLNETGRARPKPTVPQQSVYLQPSVRPNHVGQLHRGGYAPVSDIGYNKHPSLLPPMQAQQPPQAAVKRPRSPSPPPRTKEAAWMLPPASTGGGASAVASHYAAAAAAGHGNLPMESTFARAVAAAAAGRDDAKHMRLNPQSFSIRAPNYTSERERQHPKPQMRGVPHPPPTAHGQPAGGARAPFRTGSIMTGYPRYQPPPIVSTSALSRQSASPRISHAGAQNGARYYREN